MLREADFIESDWGALSWAVGSTTALLRHSVPRQLQAWLEAPLDPSGRTLKNIGMKTAGILSGGLIAGSILMMGVLTRLRLVPAMFPAWRLDHSLFVESLRVIVIPAAAFIVAAVALWRQQRSIATGMLLGVMTFVAHVIIHIATHG
jgi:hypothetical protein